jgi:hypothetical protein
MGFVDGWRERLDDVAKSRSWVMEREVNVKRNRARLANQQALDRWNGGSGVGRHEFRWSVVRDHLLRLHPFGQTP